jgi:hypothetical protein
MFARRLAKGSAALLVDALISPASIKGALLKSSNGGPLCQRHEASLMGWMRGLQHMARQNADAARLPIPADFS